MPTLTLLFISIVLSLIAAFVAMFKALEHTAENFRARLALVRMSSRRQRR